MSEQMSKAQLLERMQGGHQQFKTLLARLSDGQMSRPGVIGEWSVKDILAHIVVHEQRMSYWLEKRLRGTVPETPQPYGMPDDDLAEVNEQIYLENRDRSLAGVLIHLEEIFEQVLALVSASSEEDLMDSNRFRLQGGEPLWEAVAANTFWHYKEHGQDISTWLECQCATSAFFS